MSKAHEAFWILKILAIPNVKNQKPLCLSINNTLILDIYNYNLYIFSFLKFNFLYCLSGNFDFFNKSQTFILSSLDIFLKSSSVKHGFHLSKYLFNCLNFSVV